MLEEKISKNLNLPYVFLPKYQRFLLSNGVLFTLEEYKNGLDLQAECEKRKENGTLYDYDYAKNTGFLRRKRGTVKTESAEKQEVIVPVQQKTVNEKTGEVKEQKEKSVIFICTLLFFTSLISAYISTLHTATYLYAYADVFSSWLMSTSVTAYNTTAFEVGILFGKKKRKGLTFIFMSLWTIVTLFSMATTVSVFYDKYNFQEKTITEENKELDAGKLSLSLLEKKEKDLREAIMFKKKDIEYRQERDYATTSVRNELTKLEEELQGNLSEQQRILSTLPEITEKTVKRKESLFGFLGRLFKIEGGILEFIMSTLSAIFVNLIAPFSLVAVTEILNKNT